MTDNDASGLNDDIGRLASLSDSGGTLESDDDLGLGTVVRRSHPQPDLDLAFPGTGPGTRRAVGSSADRLATLSAGDRTQAWDFDARGNWDWLKTDGGSPRSGKGDTLKTSCVPFSAPELRPLFRSKVKLEDKVRAEYGVGVGKIKTDATVPVKYKVKINAHNIKVNLAGTAPATWLPSVDPNTKAEDAIQKAGEYLAQVGIKLVPSRANGNFSEVADPPPNVTNGNGIEESPHNLVNGKIAMTDEEKSLLTNEIQSQERTDIELYFVLRLTRESHGEAFPASYVPSAVYADSVVIAKKLTDPSVIAHELVHVLADTATHHDARWNLMYKQPLEFEAVYAKKRLTIEQETDIHTKRANPLLHAP